MNNVVAGLAYQMANDMMQNPHETADAVAGAFTFAAVAQFVPQLLTTAYEIAPAGLGLTGDTLLGYGVLKETQDALKGKCKVD